jgi:hypothetical protein
MTINLAHDNKIKQFMRAVPTVCSARHLPLPDLRYFVTERNARVWAFAVIDVNRMASKIEAYHTTALLDHLSTLMQGTPITYSNSSGLRFAALIDGPAELPDRIELPTHLGAVQIPIGVDVTGKPIATTWAASPHLAVVGQTGSGKSSFLRVIALQAILNGDRLLIADPPGTTLRMLNGHPAVLAKVAQSPQEVEALLQQAASIADERAKLYAALEARGQFPENLDEYNSLVTADQRLPRVIIILDEFTALCEASGGKNSSIAKTITSLAWQARKFGLHLVPGGQSFNVEYVGPIKNEMVGICFGVKASQISRSVVGRSGAETIRVPGRALTEKWGLLQTYFLDKARLIELAAGGSKIDAEVVRLATWCRAHNGGKFTEGWLVGVAELGQKEARRLREAWRENGWIAKDPERDNADCLTELILNQLEGGSSGPSV